MEEFDRLKKLVADVEVDVVKAEGGNQAASVRVRKVMQEIKKASQTVRTRLLEVRQAGAPTVSAPQTSPPSSA